VFQIQCCCSVYPNYRVQKERAAINSASFFHPSTF